MVPLVIEQALFHRQDGDHPVLLGRSTGFDDLHAAEALRSIEAFGERTGGLACPGALFGQPFGNGRVVVVQVVDLPGGKGLGFRFLLLSEKDYRMRGADPFALSDAFPPVLEAKGDLPTLEWERTPPPPRTVAEVQAVLRQVKAHALKEDEDPEDEEFIHTVENSLSPALLGGVQVLVDGGRLVLKRSAPDDLFVRSLWTLLPNRMRATLWPATFAFSDRLDCRILVVPTYDLVMMEGCTTEDMAADYPPGSYELALQTAAEGGDQAALDRVLERRSSQETKKLAMVLLVFVALLVLLSRWGIGPPEDGPPLPRRDPELAVKAATAAAIVGVGDPWTAFGLVQQGNARWRKE